MPHAIGQVMRPAQASMAGRGGLQSNSQLRSILLSSIVLVDTEEHFQSLKWVLAGTKLLCLVVVPHTHCLSTLHFCFVALNLVSNKR